MWEKGAKSAKDNFWWWRRASFMFDANHMLPLIRLDFSEGGPTDLPLCFPFDAPPTLLSLTSSAHNLLRPIMDTLQNVYTKAVGYPTTWLRFSQSFYPHCNKFQFFSVFQLFQNLSTTSLQHKTCLSSQWSFSLPLPIAMYNMIWWKMFVVSIQRQNWTEGPP